MLIFFFFRLTIWKTKLFFFTIRNNKQTFIIIKAFKVTFNWIKNESSYNWNTLFFFNNIAKFAVVLREHNNVGMWGKMWFQSINIHAQNNTPLLFLQQKQALTLTNIQHFTSFYDNTHIQFMVKIKYSFLGVFSICSFARLISRNYSRKWTTLDVEGSLGIFYIHLVEIRPKKFFFTKLYILCTITNIIPWLWNKGQIE